MPAIVISPKSTDASAEIVNRFFSSGNLLLLSSDPMGAEVMPHCSENWYRIPENLEDSVDQEQVARTVQSVVENAVRDEQSISGIFVFPNKSANESFLTTSYQSLLSAFSSNVVIPMTVIVSVLEYGIAMYPELPIYIFYDRDCGFESTVCFSGLYANIAAAKIRDKTGQSERIDIHKVECSGGDFLTRLDTLCEKEYDKLFWR